MGADDCSGQHSMAAALRPLPCITTASIDPLPTPPSTCSATSCVSQISCSSRRPRPACRITSALAASSWRPSAPSASTSRCRSSRSSSVGSAWPSAPVRARMTLKPVRTEGSAPATAWLASAATRSRSADSSPIRIAKLSFSDAACSFSAGRVLLS